MNILNQSLQIKAKYIRAFTKNWNWTETSHWRANSSRSQIHINRMQRPLAARNFTEVQGAFLKSKSNQSNMLSNFSTVDLKIYIFWEKRLNDKCEMLTCNS